ncbi:protein of unknown function (plasmid) [Cupriavidus taiwanensis]|uniref:Uncharacterized protein n=1 Tax=Cupriavidus taiwanensis TaxID=164546 RepID=A0A375IMA5_9BURK|nr:hypothetical protein CBM2617_B110037 [Cupriavidus taiwanensis]SPD56965.1 protein of unknown function [Cupriavidus taiwanensis]SPK75220.1 protein of unknown function [Cupriavidus taiwanensis]
MTAEPRRRCLDDAPAHSHLVHGSYHGLSFHRMIFSGKSFYCMRAMNPAKARIIL